MTPKWLDQYRVSIQYVLVLSLDCLSRLIVCSKLFHVWFLFQLLIVYVTLISKRMDPYGLDFLLLVIVLGIPVSQIPVHRLFCSSTGSLNATICPLNKHCPQSDFFSQTIECPSKAQMQEWLCFNN